MGPQVPGSAAAGRTEGTEVRNPYLPAAVAGSRANSRRRPRGKLSPGGEAHSQLARHRLPSRRWRWRWRWRRRRVRGPAGERRRRRSLGARGWGWGSGSGSGGLARLRGGSLGAASAPQPGAPETPAAAAAARPPAPPPRRRSVPPSLSPALPPLPKPPPLQSPVAAAAAAALAAAVKARLLRRAAPLAPSRAWSPPSIQHPGLAPGAPGATLCPRPLLSPLPSSPLCSRALSSSEFRRSAGGVGSWARETGVLIPGKLPRCPPPPWPDRRAGGWDNPPSGPRSSSSRCPGRTC